MSQQGFIAPPLSSSTDGHGEPVVFSEALLWAGDLVIGATPMRLSTVLGSCVSVCLFDPERGIGGMNHYLVPRGGKSAIHGDWSTARLIEEMVGLGSAPRALQAKVFGGGTPLRLANDTCTVGEGNVAVAREILAASRIPIVAERVGHTAGLRLFFESWTGVVWVRLHAERN
jgi:chemotaxis protein CheD